MAAPFLGNKSDKIGYRRVLLIALLGATLDDVAAGFRRQLLGRLPRCASPSGCSSAEFCRPPMRWSAAWCPRSQRGTVYGITSSAMFLGNSLGPLSGGAVAAAFGLRWVFLITGMVLLANLVWVYYRVPEYVDSAKSGETA